MLGQRDCDGGPKCSIFEIIPEIQISKLEDWVPPSQSLCPVMPAAFHTEFAKLKNKLSLQLFCWAVKWCVKTASLAYWESFQVVAMIFRFMASSRSALRKSMFKKWGVSTSGVACHQPVSLRVPFKFRTARVGIKQWREQTPLEAFVFGFHFPYNQGLNCFLFSHFALYLFLN